MKILILIFVSLLNLVLWFDNVQSIQDLSFYLPFISILLSIIYILPRTRNSGIEIKIIYFTIAGILFYSSPLYFRAIFYPDSLLDDLLFFGIKEKYFIKSNLLLGISLPLIVAGYSTYFKETKKNKSILVKKNDVSNKDVFVFSILGSLFLFLSVSVTGLSIGSTYIGVSSYYYVLLVRMVYMLVIMAIYKKLFNNRNTNKLIEHTDFFPIVVILLMIIYLLIGGDRGPVFTILLILFFGYAAFNRMTIKLKTLFLLLFSTVLFYSLFIFIEVLRVSDVTTLSKETITNAYIVYQNYETTPGLQIRTTSLAIEGIQNNLYPHTYGFFTLQSIIKGIPFIGNMIVSTFVEANSMFADGSARLLTIQNSGFNYTSGLGTTYLADTYIEFGIVGIILFSFLYGMLIGKFDKKLKEMSFRNFTDFLLIALFVAFSFYVGRSTIVGFFVHFIHSWIFYIIIKYAIINPLIKLNIK